MHKSHAVLPLLLALAACSQSEPPAAASAPAESTQATTTQQAGHPTVAIEQPGNTPAAPAAPGATPAAPGATPGAPGATPPTGQAPMNLGTLQRALTAASQAAANPEGDTHCEQAFNGMNAMIHAMQKATGRGHTRELNRDAFLRGCNELPPQMQQCMVMSYGMQHRQECQAARAQLTPELQARVQAIMRGETGDGDDHHAEADDDHDDEHHGRPEHDEHDDDHDDD